MNGALMLQVLAPILALARRNSRALAVLHFRVSPAGPEAELPQSPEVVAAIASAIREEDIVARVGPDTFAVGLTEVWEPDAAVRVARRVARSLGELDSGDGPPRVAIGAAFFPGDGDDGPALLEAAKRATPANASMGFADPELGREALRRSGLLRDLSGPGVASQFELHYQPIRSMETGHVVGAEALLRWNRSGALLPAADFIGLAEATGRIRAIDRWSIEHALRETRVWADAGWDGWVSINLSGRSLAAPGFASVVKRIMEESRATPDRVVFEVTEGAALAGNGAVRKALNDLRELGSRVAIDDFGTGYASFEYLCQFDPDLVKLDRAFVARNDGIDSARLLTALVDMAQSLGKPVVVEGVEHHPEWERVAVSGCDLVQGYLMGRPVPGPTFVRHHVAPDQPRRPARGAARPMAISAA